MKRITMFDTIIVGGGPAGITAAIYLTRAGQKVALIEKDCLGGQMALSPYIENYPGFVGSGVELMEKMWSQVQEDLCEVILDEVVEVTSVHDEQLPFLTYAVKTAAGDVFTSYTVIWTTGSSHKQLNVPGEQDAAAAQKVCYCATCDGPFFRGQKVAVIGDGNSAVQYVIELARYCQEVFLLIPTDKIFAEQILQDRLHNLSNVTIVTNFLTKGFKMMSDDELIIEDTNRWLVVQGAFVAIGQQPHNEIIGDDLATQLRGYINETKTSGFFAAGDCVNKKYRQVAGAVHDGMVVALDAIKYIANRCGL